LPEEQQPKAKPGTSTSETYSRRAHKNRKTGEEYEKLAEEYFGLVRTRGSGSGRQKGDAWSRTWFFEAKATSKAHMRVEAQWWRKAITQAGWMRKPHVALGIRFGKREIEGPLGFVLIAADMLPQLGISSINWRPDEVGVTARVRQFEIATFADGVGHNITLDRMKLSAISERTFRRTVLNEIQ